jgi:hypothetical protein
MSNPLDDYLGMRKRAFGPLGPNFGHAAARSFQEGAAQATGQYAVGLGAAGIGVAAMKIYRAVRKRKDFKDMLEQNPDLASYQEQDPVKFNAHYNSLRTMNPGYAEDPTIAGTLMRQMSMHPHTAGKVLMEGMESSSRALPRSQSQFSISSKFNDKDQETGSSYRF